MVSPRPAARATGDQGAGAHASPARSRVRLGKPRTRARPRTLEQKADLALAGAHAVAGSVKAVDLVYGLAGTSAIYTRNPLERHFRDIHTVRHHGFCSEGRYETAGQVYLGVEPEFGFVAL